MVKPPIYKMLDENEGSEIHIMEAKDCPQAGVTSYATVGLSEYPLFLKGKEFSLRVEVVGACGSAFPSFANIISTIGFCIINSKWFCAPGVIFPDIIKMYNISSTMNDVYFTTPFLWGDKFQSLDIDGKTTAWLLAVPISRQEADYAYEYGSEKLEELFVEHEIDIYNLERPSVV